MTLILILYRSGVNKASEYVLGQMCMFAQVLDLSLAPHCVL